MPKLSLPSNCKGCINHIKTALRKECLLGYDKEGYVPKELCPRELFVRAEIKREMIKEE